MDSTNIDYFLFLKKKYIVILSYLIEIINTYEELSLHNNEFFLQYDKYKNELHEIKYLINNVNNTICQLCDHIFVEDEIDLSPDMSKRIEYCKVCEYTKHYGFPLM